MLVPTAQGMEMTSANEYLEQYLNDRNAYLENLLDDANYLEELKQMSYRAQEALDLDTYEWENLDYPVCMLDVYDGYDFLRTINWLLDNGYVIKRKSDLEAEPLPVTTKRFICEME